VTESEYLRGYRDGLANAADRVLNDRLVRPSEVRHALIHTEADCGDGPEGVCQCGAHLLGMTLTSSSSMLALHIRRAMNTTESDDHAPVRP